MGNTQKERTNCETPAWTDIADAKSSKFSMVGAFDRVQPLLYKVKKALGCLGMLI